MTGKQERQRHPPSASRAAEEPEAAVEAMRLLEAEVAVGSYSEAAVETEDGRMEAVVVVELVAPLVEEAVAAVVPCAAVVDLEVVLET